MVRLKDLLRSNNEGEEPEIVAPIDYANTSIDCGLKISPCINKYLEKYAKSSYLCVILSLVGFFQGVILNYFRGTSQIWSTHLNIDRDSADWLIYINEVFVGIFAFVVAYWGNRFHRPVWLGTTTIYVSIAGLVLTIFDIYLTKSNVDIIDDIADDFLCKASIPEGPKIENFHITGFVLFTLFQLIFATASISFISHGITYLDDNISPNHSPAFIACALAANTFGKQAGIYLSWAPFVLNFQNIFYSTVWLILLAITFLSGVLMTMFPKFMPSIVSRKGAESLISLMVGIDDTAQTETIDGFFVTIRRIFTNKILLLNALSIALIQSAVFSFNMFEKYYNQSKYHIPKNDDSGYNDPTIIFFLTNLLKQPLIGVFTITCGLFIAKVRPRAKYLIIWNLFVIILLTIFFAGSNFWSCTEDLENEHPDKLSLPHCSGDCVCGVDSPFQPVCINKKTYFSPCMAGCTASNEDHGTKMFTNCTCGGTEAISGSCNSKKCLLFLSVAQVNGIITAALLSTTVMTSVIINMRCILSKDKAMALALYATFAGLLPYAPIKIIYDLLLDNFCQYYGKTKCQLYSDSLSMFLSICTIVLMCISALLSVILTYYVANTNLYSDKKVTEMKMYDDGGEDDDMELDLAEAGNTESGTSNSTSQPVEVPRPKELEDIKPFSPLVVEKPVFLSEGNLLSPFERLIKGESAGTSTDYSYTDSLRDMENIGDDHDSGSEDAIVRKYYQKLAANAHPQIINETEF